jgi:hypothetical protein
MKLLIMLFYPTSYHFIPLHSKYFPYNPVLKHPLLTFLPYKTTDKTTVSYILILMFSDGKREDKRFWTEWQQALPVREPPTV